MKLLNPCSFKENPLIRTSSHSIVHSPRALRNTSTRCEAEQMNGCREKKSKVRPQRFFRLRWILKSRKKHIDSSAARVQHVATSGFFCKLYSPREVGASRCENFKFTMSLCNVSRVYIYRIQCAG